MEKEKYYTPSSEEFHIGFEYESYDTRWQYDMDSVIKKEDGSYSARVTSEPKIVKGWHKCTFDGTDFTFTEDDVIGIDFDLTPLRVKYLDSSDIESFGFIFKDKCQWEIPFTYSFNEMGIGEVKNVKGGWKLIYTKDHYCSIVKDRYGETNHFRGTIKNKSELALVLKMIGVI